ncbi:helix-turn-helix domain-containing protein [Streptomyces chilikensis]|uniref:Helix-turn-helix transcriptional regulator n=1 Tax=Streptomyces chilikensis TaxID=1194079 RepID=A0ABV3EXX7_9ACTN
MEHQTATGPIEAITRRVREARNRKGMTAQELADRLKESGVPWDRGTVTKLETGRRQNVSVVELLALARALDVAPIHLLVPLEDGGTYMATPNEPVKTARARYWIRGLVPLGRTDVRVFRTEVPSSELEAWDEERQAHDEQEHREAPKR